MMTTSMSASSGVFSAQKSVENLNCKKASASTFLHQRRHRRRGAVRSHKRSTAATTMMNPNLMVTTENFPLLPSSSSTSTSELNPSKTNITETQQIPSISLSAIPTYPTIPKEQLNFKAALESVPKPVLPVIVLPKTVALPFFYFNLSSTMKLFKEKKTKNLVSSSISNPSSSSLKKRATTKATTITTITTIITTPTKSFKSSRNQFIAHTKSLTKKQKDSSSTFSTFSRSCSSIFTPTQVLLRDRLRRVRSVRKNSTMAMGRTALTRMMRSSTFKPSSSKKLNFPLKPMWAHLSMSWAKQSPVSSELTPLPTISAICA